MRVIPLGTSSGVPTRQRNVASVAILMDTSGYFRMGSPWILIDCGEGTQHRLLNTPLRANQLDAVLISHLHGDHLFGLPGLLSTFSLQGRTKPLDVYGPPDLEKFLRRAFEFSKTRLAFEIDIHSAGSGKIRDTSLYFVDSLPLDHVVPAIGYRVQIQAGPQERQRAVAYCSDTRPCPSSVKLAESTDLLVHEATYADSLAGLARERGHSTAKEAAETARNAGAKLLALTHFSPRYQDLSPLLEEARAVFPQTILAHDLEKIELAHERERAA